jgi:glutamine---fructose-6-phosphate transaminase (isomerizing)
MNGALMLAEMAEQPRVLRRLVARRAEFDALVHEVVPEGLRGIVLVARGSSDNAAVLGRYLLEVATGCPVVLAAPSLQTRYGVQPRVEGFLAVGISQSGATPEIVSSLAAYGAGGATTLAVTNVDGSALADAADATLLLGAGAEEAVPATKTFTAQAATFCLLAEALAPSSLWPDHGWATTLDAIEEVLSSPETVADLADRLATAERVVSVGRGFLYGAALEVGLKLAETTGIAVHGTSPFDLRHGPIATVREHTHTVCLATPGPVAVDVEQAARDMRERGATIAAIAEAADLVDAASLVVPVPPGVPEPLAALPQVVRGQQLAMAVALARGIDPDAPFELSKVTRTT